MRILGYGLAVLTVVLAGLLGWAFTLAPEWRLERSAEIAAPPGPVFAYVSLLRNWPEWTAWSPAEYPDLKYEFSGPEWGVGAVQRWHGGGMGGQLRVTDFLPGEYLEYELEMDGGKVRLRGSLRIEAAGAGSRLRWSCWGNSGSNPLHRLLIRAYLPLIGRDFERGLRNLQARFREQAGAAG